MKPAIWCILFEYMKHISIDLGDTLFNRQLPKTLQDKWSVRQLFPSAIEVIKDYKDAGWKISVISKIDPGAELRVGMNLIYHNIVPNIIDVDDVHFCYSRDAKGAIARDIGSDIHIDDRVEALNSVHNEGVKHKIIFIGGHDERNNLTLSFEGVHVAHDWEEVRKIIDNLE